MNVTDLLLEEMLWRMMRNALGESVNWKMIGDSFHGGEELGSKRMYGVLGGWKGQRAIVG